MVCRGGGELDCARAIRGGDVEIAVLDVLSGKPADIAMLAHVVAQRHKEQRHGRGALLAVYDAAQLAAAMRGVEQLGGKDDAADEVRLVVFACFDDVIQKLLALPGAPGVHALEHGDGHLGVGAA